METKEFNQEIQSQSSVESEYLLNEARSLLLRGCYKMAKTKYITLLSHEHSVRSLSIIHTNIGLCYHNLCSGEEEKNKPGEEFLEKALQHFTEAIRIDPSYIKAYYRMLQVLRQLHKYNEALKLYIPFTNFEIDTLKNTILEELVQHAELKDLMQNHINNDIRKEVQRKCMLQNCAYSEKYVEWIFKSESIIYEQFVEDVYYTIQEVNNHKRLLEDYVFELENTQIPTLLSEFGFYFINKLLKVENFSSLLLIEIKLLPFVADTKIFFLAINEFIKIENFFSNIFENIHYKLLVIWVEKLKTCLFTKFNEFQEKLEELLEKLGICIETENNIKNIKIKLMFIEGFFEIRENKYKINKDSSFVDVIEFCLKGCKKINNSSSKEKANSLFTSENITDYFSVHLNSISHLYLLSICLEEIPFEPTYKKLIPKCACSILTVYIMLRLQLPLSLFETNLILEFSKTEDEYIYLKTLFAFCLQSKKNRLAILKQRPLIEEFMSGNNLGLQNVDEISITLIELRGAIMGVLIGDVEKKEYEIEAEKLEIDVEEFKKLKNIGRKEEVNSEEYEEYRKMANEQISIDLIKEMCKKINAYNNRNEKNNIENNKNKNIIADNIMFNKTSNSLKFLIEELCTSHLMLHSEIIEYMLSTHSSFFFSKITKKINPAQILYKHISRVIKILYSTIEISTDELLIFESLLGLLNLNNEFLPLSPFIALLSKENSYIVHGALENINNILVRMEENDEEIQIAKLKDIILKYNTFYKNLVLNNYNENKDIKDYAHPSRVYNTIISIGILLKLPFEELKNWNYFVTLLKHIQVEAYVTLFKVVLYFDRTLKKGWQKDVEEEIKLMKIYDQDKWNKIKQYY